MHSIRNISRPRVLWAGLALAATLAFGIEAHGQTGIASLNESVDTEARATEVMTTSTSGNMVGRDLSWAGIADELTDGLLSSDAETRNDALVKTIQIARHHSDEVDVSATIPSLLDIVRQDNMPRRRVAAIVGLTEIGDKGSLQDLAKILKHENDSWVRHVGAEAVERGLND